MFIDKGELFLEILDHMWERGKLEAEAIAKLLDKIGLKKDSRILEIGCGNGRILINLAHQGYRKLVGIDISPIFIEHAKKKMDEYKVEGIEFIVGDALRLNKSFGRDEFDVAMYVWTTILGYYRDENIDAEILRKTREIVKKGGYLLILNTANRDYILKMSEYYRGPFYTEHGDLVVIEYPKFDPKNSVNKTRWRFYRKMENGDLKFLDEIEFQLRLYSIHEIIRIAEGAGWEYVEAYSRITTLEEFWPTRGALNIVFKAI